MIVVRNVFKLKFGKAKEVKVLMQEAVSINKKNGINDVRVLTDITGPSYTMVFETTHESLAVFESKIHTILGSPEWGKMYEKFIPFVDSAYREIFTIV